MVAGVLVELSDKNIDRIFDYSIPSSMEEEIKVGMRVTVPFGRMTVDGFVLDIKNSSSMQSLKEILSIVDTDIVLNNELLALGRKMKEDTLSTLISCYQVMLPKALKAKNGKNVSILYDTYYSVNPDIDLSSFKLSSSMKKILSLFDERTSILKKELEEVSSSSLKNLKLKGILLEEKKEHYRLLYSSNTSMKKELTEEQKNVVSNVIQSEPKNYLLYGVTGSGKTEVYMEMIDYYLSLGKTAICLVPEISLTPQMISRFQMRFGDKIAALHSALSDGEKYDEWRRIARGEASIVIGARSAIFAPLQNIGIIIIDEEHSDSYKQSDSNPRYHARDIAIIRGLTHHAPVVLGSATPTLESMARASKGVYTLLELPHRVNGAILPIVEIIDMNSEIKKSKGHFSSTLITEMEAALSNHEQIILLLNRRGYSSFITCKNCGFTFKCPNCDITLTYHKSSQTLRCHYCGYGEKVYTTCPSCKHSSLNDLGVGTEKVEEEIYSLFPNSRVLRMDYDTTSRKGSHEKMITAFRNQEYDILLGTQIVSKGLDFPNVTLVGVINADTSLNIPDFRSSENTFQLLSQVAGRAGRSAKKGKVLIQTYNPDHYAITYSKMHDYFGFYQKEMSIRRLLKYPPYFYLCSIRIQSVDENLLKTESSKIEKILKSSLFIPILGPSPCPMYRLNNIYRYGIILKYKTDDGIREVLEKILDHYKTIRKIRIDIDFNPSQIL